jgi:hypothetical protein
MSNLDIILHIKFHKLYNKYEIYTKLLLQCKYKYFDNN